MTRIFMISTTLRVVSSHYQYLDNVSPANKEQLYNRRPLRSNFTQVRASSERKPPFSRQKERSDMVLPSLKSPELERDQSSRASSRKVELPPEEAKLYSKPDYNSDNVAYQVYFLSFII